MPPVRSPGWIRGIERGALLPLLVLAAVARAEEPTVRKLDPSAGAPSQSPSKSPSKSIDEAPARRLPSTVAVCLDRGAGRCWLAPRGEDCRGDATPNGDVFRVVIDDAARVEPNAALDDCRTSLTRAKTP
jgi:hypothetical protein